MEAQRSQRTRKKEGSRRGAKAQRKPGATPIDGVGSSRTHGKFGVRYFAPPG